MGPRSFVVLTSILAFVGCAPGPDGSARSGDGTATRHDDAPRGARCDSSYPTFCGVSGEADDERSDRLDRIVRSIEDATLGVLSARVGFSPATREGWQRHLAAQEPARRDELRRLFRKVRASEVEQRVAPLRDAAEAELASVLESARERVRESDDPERDATLARLEAARLSWIDLGDTSPLHARALRRGCGDSLLVDDAWVDKSATAITLCPGFLLVSTEPGDPEDGGPAFRQRIAFLLAHEVGHVIVGPTERTAEDERAAEIAADAWAAEILASEIAAIADPLERALFLRRTLEPICSPEADRVHPSGPDRVGAVAGVLGCGA